MVFFYNFMKDFFFHFKIFNLVEIFIFYLSFLLF